MLPGGDAHFGTKVKAEGAPGRTEGMLPVKAGFTQSQATGGPGSCTVHEERISYQPCVGLEEEARGQGSYGHT